MISTKDLAIPGSSELPVTVRSQKKLLSDYYQTKDPKLLERIVVLNAPLVFAELSKLPRVGEREDRESEGMLGLTRAAITFNPNLGFEFSTHAGNCVRRQLKRFINKHKSPGFSAFKGEATDSSAGWTRGTIQTAYSKMLEDGLPRAQLEKHFAQALDKCGMRPEAIELQRIETLQAAGVWFLANNGRAPRRKEIISLLGWTPEAFDEADQVLEAIRRGAMGDLFPNGAHLPLDRHFENPNGIANESLGQAVHVAAPSARIDETERVVLSEPIKTAIARLPTAVRHLIRLHASEGHRLERDRGIERPAPTISEVFGLSRARAKQLFDHGLDLLRWELRDLPQIAVTEPDVLGAQGVPPTLLARADALVAGGSWFVTEAGFIEGIARLREFCRNHDSEHISALLTDRDNFPLGAWVRLNKRLNWEKLLEAPRKAAIELAAPNLNWRFRDDGFEEGLRHLGQHVQENNGKANVTQTYVAPDGFPLGKWMDNLRVAARGEDFDETRRAEVMAIAPSFDWNPAATRFAQAFDLGVQRLKEFRTLHGHPNVPQAYVTPADKFALGAWVRNLRHRPQSEARRKQVMDVVPDFVWTPREERALKLETAATPALPDPEHRQLDLRRAIAPAMQALSPDDRLFVRLRFEEDMEIKQVAEVMRIPTAVARKREKALVTQLERTLAGATEGFDRQSEVPHQEKEESLRGV